MGLLDKITMLTENHTEPPAVAECDAKLTQLEQQKKEVLYRIGEKYAASNTVETAAGIPYEEEMTELQNIEREFVQTEKRKLAVQGLRKCEKCGNVLAIESAFCNKCGEKLEALQLEPAGGENTCPNCGSAYEEGTAFCTTCGTKL
ncbi:MAG: zinc ribbon domain-containing protein [Lachnospiraceae bacterium]|nr:zinc ribbon domain-containing protein [Lachnospiraceae bacterium]